MPNAPRNEMPPEFATNDLPGLNSGPDAWEAYISRLATKQIPMNRDLIRIVVERREVPRAAADGDAVAVARLAELNQRHLQVVDGLDGLTLATSVARERLERAADGAR
jgi:hypothetical protein